MLAKNLPAREDLRIELDGRRPPSDRKNSVKRQWSNGCNWSILIGITNNSVIKVRRRSTTMSGMERYRITVPGGAGSSNGKARKEAPIL